MAEQVRRAQQAAEDQSFRAGVEALLGEVLADANDRDTEAIAGHVDSIRQALGKELEGVVDLLFGGSVAKRTYVEGLSDVDALVVLNQSELAKLAPDAVCSYVLERLSERFPGKVTADGFAITVEFADSKVQVIPAIQKGSDYLLPSDDCTSWSRVQPKAFTEVLTATNKACAGKLVPTVKLVKALLSELPEGKSPTGYHLENLAVEAFTGYSGPTTPREMLHHFFAKAPDLIRTPIADRTGQSTHVDEYLGGKEGVNRLIVADAVARIGRRLLNADGAGDLDQWKRMFGAEP